MEKSASEEEGIFCPLCVFNANGREYSDYLDNAMILFCLPYLNFKGFCFP